ncbi:tRNA modification GTPase TrmE [Candidatus Phycorickettsia trachydisci]|uniref:tRNA modification GTPase MnmE n=1 Tax=Candidatus Phycorickettsia trachydisci TaxID=2115978 RepID=A0A2P1PA14_9RICK|nr:tRNA uridine-5-carboxymethylaminomethyl(34) synthesis GTPase MnmE [Candidatus Phycorickettsia trachydisci]AVP88111.1 tRNA modification GTPase TrmE [Candidatus Phycorickettsia trachydisci]
MTTIFAQCSGLVKAGVAVYRISGPRALYAAQCLTKKAFFEPRKAYLLDVFDPVSDELIDKGLVLYFKAPSSFTGEDIIEFHLHGSLAISKLMYKSLAIIQGVRIANPGEFSKRAYINGKFDLIQAEGLVDLINAETQMQHKQAMQQSSGLLSGLYESWRKSLLKVMSYLEAYIDFPEEGISSKVLGEIERNIQTLKQQMKNHLDDHNRGEVIREGINLSIFGPPNVGKSSLINYIANKNVAIVSPMPGTTRDSIETFIDIQGYPVCVMDTAGIRNNTYDVIELEGIKRAVTKTQAAHIKLLVVDVEIDVNNLDKGIKDLIDDKTILVINKVDLNPNIPIISDAIYISLKQKINLEELMEKILDKIKKISPSLQNPYITRERHRQNVEVALSLLNNFSLEKDLVLAAEDIRLSARRLSLITGKITADEILGEIFSSFCIGK